MLTCQTAYITAALKPKVTYVDRQPTIQSQRPRVNPIPKQTSPLKVKLLTNLGTKTRSTTRLIPISWHNNRARFETTLKVWLLQTVVQTVELLHPEGDQRMHTYDQ